MGRVLTGMNDDAGKGKITRHATSLSHNLLIYRGVRRGEVRYGSLQRPVDTPNQTYRDVASDSGNLSNQTVTCNTCNHHFTLETSTRSHDQISFSLRRQMKKKKKVTRVIVG
jgi:hypothetical protein